MSLGATAVVRLQIMTIDCEKQHPVTCCVLQSSKPIWNGELKNCDTLLRTNVLGDLGFCVISNNGSKVMPVEAAEPSKQCEQSNEGNPSMAKVSQAGLKLGWVIQVHQVTFRSGLVGLTQFIKYPDLKWFIKYPGLTLSMHLITCVNHGVWSCSK